MLVRIACLLVLIASAAASYACRADEPAAKPAITVLHNLRYRDGPSKQWQLDLAMPRDRGGKPRPAIVVIHGGGWLEGDRSSFASKKHGVPGNIEDFAALGFVAVTINYRLSGEAPFPAALEDCRCAVRWLRSHAKEYHIDAGRIGAYGNSAGGHLAMLLGMPGKDADESSRVQAVVSDSGPIDLIYQHEHNQLRQVVSKFVGGPPEGKRLAAYRQASPRHQIGKATPPLLLIYGVADEQVPVDTADDFVTALHRAGVQDVTYHRLAYVGHCPHSLVRIPTMQSAVNAFFLRTLMHPETAQQVRRQTPAIFNRSNLVAWCIVPFDSKHRTPAERAAMVKRLRFTKVAYDWRDKHVPMFEEEIREYQKHGIEYYAFWGAHEKAFTLFAKYDLHPQIWQTLPSPKAATQEERVAAAAKQMLPLVERTAKMKCKLGLYNHGGWGGEPENLVAVCKRLREEHKGDHVGIVYNLHHGHGHIKDFAQALARMKPYLLCLNLNGMSGAGPQILPLGAGEHDVTLLKTIRDSGYGGPLGIIGHTNDDVELRLRDNLDGLDWILPQLDGKPAGPRPKYRTR